MTEIECCKCHKVLTSKIYYVKCDLLNKCHGDNCHCELPLGSDCYKRILKDNGLRRVRPSVKGGKQ